MRILRLLASHPIFLFKLNKSGFDECYQSAIKWEIWKSKTQCLCAFAGPHIHFLLIPTRPLQKHLKQVWFGDLAEAIYITWIIGCVLAIQFFVAIVLPAHWSWYRRHLLTLYVSFSYLSRVSWACHRKQALRFSVSKIISYIYYSREYTGGQDNPTGTRDMGRPSRNTHISKNCTLRRDLSRVNYTSNFLKSFVWEIQGIYFIPHCIME